MEFIKNVYTREDAIEVKDYPYWFLKTSKFYWIEKNKRGYRVITSTINPKTWKENKPKKGVYYPYIRFTKEDNWHINYSVCDLWSCASFVKARDKGLFQDEDIKELEELAKVARIIEIKAKVIYWGYELDLIKDLTIEELANFDNLTEEEKQEFKTEEGKQENYSPFTITSY